MTLYIAAYDTETPACLAACRKIVAMHRRFDMPATFFVTGRCLEDNPDEFRELLSDPLFEVASHTYSHKTLREHPICGPAVSPSEIEEEVRLGKEWVERVFAQPCLGMRPACGFPHGLTGAPELLQLIGEAGVRYVSSVLWGPSFSLPAPVAPPFSYASEGYPDLWEIPGHGWHENLLKGNNRIGPVRILLFPPPFPEAIPADYVRTPEEEFRYNNRVFIDRALAGGLPHVSLIWHPWSLNAFDPEMSMLALTFRYVRDQRLEVGTFAELAARMQPSPGAPDGH